MQKHQQDTKKVSAPPAGSWMWRDETQTLEFVSSNPTGDSVSSNRRQTNVNFSDLQRRSEWLAQCSTLNHRGRQSIRNSLNPAHLDAYRISAMQKQEERITISDVKQVAVRLLQENYLLPIPQCFLAVLKSKETDEVLAALLLYLSCYFEHKSLESQPEPLRVVNINKEKQMMAQSSAKKEMAQKKLAVCYFTLLMNVETEQHRRATYLKSWGLSNRTEWLLHACLYSFFCFVAWVTFGRKDLVDIQEEVWRLLYSDAFKATLRNKADDDSGMTSTADECLMKTGGAGHKEMGCHSSPKQRTSQRCPALSRIVNQHSPLMASLLPSPQEQSPHLFLGIRARKQSLLQAEHRDTKTLMEELNQQLASISFGILGLPLIHFNCATLIRYGEQKDGQDGEHDGEAENKDF